MPGNKLSKALQGVVLCGVLLTINKISLGESLVPRVVPAEIVIVANDHSIDVVGPQVKRIDDLHFLSLYKDDIENRKRESRTISNGQSEQIVSAVQDEGGVQWAIVVGLTLLTILPAILLSATPLIRLLIVFHFLRQALGTQTAPSNQVLMGLALMMTWFLIQPVLLSIDETALTPYRAGRISGQTALSLAAIPVKKYLLHYARPKDLEVFAAASMTERPRLPEDLPLAVVVPAYIVSELKAGFEIGALLFIPFLLVDLVVASITTSVGMMQLPPVIVSTPLKILLFVMVDGWNLLVGQLLKSF